MAEQQQTSQLENDELTRTIDEYRAKVDEIVRKERERVSKLVDEESNHIIKVAWQKAEKIIAESQQEAQHAREELEEQAKKEVTKIIYDAKNEAQRLTSEAEEKAKKEARNRTKSEEDKIISKAREESNSIVSKAKEESNSIISKARQVAEKEASEITGRAKKETERLVKEELDKYRSEAQAQAAQIESKARKKAEGVINDVVASSKEISKLVMEIIQKTETIIDKFKDELQIELSESTNVMALAMKKLEQITAESDEESVTVEAISSINEELSESAIILVQLRGDKNAGGNNGNRLFRGQMELKTTSSYDYAQIKKIRNFLVKVPNIKYAGEFTSEEETKILFEVEEPLSVVDILGNLPSVEKVIEQEDGIELLLQN